MLQQSRKGVWCAAPCVLRAQRTFKVVRGAAGITTRATAATSTPLETRCKAPVGRGWRVLFFGSDEIALTTLALLLRHHRPDDYHPSPEQGGAPEALRLGVGVHNDDSASSSPSFPVAVEALEVVTGVDKVAARSVPVKQFALRAALPIHQPPRLKEWTVPLTKDGHPFDIGVVVSFGHFIPPSVLDALPCGALNMHPSLLPRHRGAAPIYHTLLQDDPVTGVTVLEIHRQRFDAGRILKQTTLPVDPLITYEPLARRLATIGAEKVLETLASYEASLSNAIPQDDCLATRAPKIDGDMAQVHWDRHEPRHIHNLWRALGHSLGIHTHFRGNRLKLLGVVPPYSAACHWPRQQTAPASGPTGSGASTWSPIPSTEPPNNPGQVQYDAHQKLLWVKCAAPSCVPPSPSPPPTSGAPDSHYGDADSSRRREMEGWVGIRQVQIEGRRVMDAAAFKNGFLAPTHTSRRPPVSFGNN